MYPELDFTTLPTLSLQERDRLPSCPAIYFALDSSDRVLYVGKATNLQSRWRDHHRFDQLNRTHKRTAVRLAWFDCSSCIAQLSAMETFYIDRYKPLLNGTQVPAKKIIPSEIVLQDSLRKLAPHLLIFGIMPVSENRKLPTVSIRYINTLSGTRITALLRRTFKTSNDKPSGLHWTQFIRRKDGSWWRTKCNGVAIELGPWLSLSSPLSSLSEAAHSCTLAGIEIQALQGAQLEAILAEFPYVAESYPGITALKADPIPLLWADSKRPENSASTASNAVVLPLNAQPTYPQSASFMENDSNASTPFENNAADISSDRPVPKFLQRTFLDIDGIEVEICTDSKNRHYVRHHLLWLIVHRHRNPDPNYNSVITNLENFANREVKTIRWVGYPFRFERIYFEEDDMELEAVLLPLALFESIIRQVSAERNPNKQPPQDDCTKLGQWLGTQALSEQLNAFALPDSSATAMKLLPPGDSSTP